MIKTRRMNRLIVDVTLGNNPRARNSEEREFVAEIKKEINESVEEIVITPEWEVE